MTFFRTHLLSIVLFTPLVGALVLLFVNKHKEDTIRWIANVVAFVGFLVSVPLWFWYDTQNPAWQFTERATWIPTIGASYFLGVDGFAILLILLTTLMGFIAILSSWAAITERVKEFYIFMLVLQTGMIGAFVTLDFLLFFLFWEVMLVPMYFLIGIWGGGRRLYSAIKFFLYTLLGSVVMLLGILALYFYYHNVTGVYTFDITLYQQMNVPVDLQRWVFLAFFLGFAIKVPMFPFHTWLPDAHTDAPTAGSVILAAVLLKMGTYGFIRFSLPILPEATHYFVPMIVTLSIVGIVYGALVALAQTDWKRLVAYSSVSHMGMVMLGMFALNPVGLVGSIVQQINHGISTGALFLIVGNVYDRRHTREISDYGGLSKVMPVFATVFLIMTMSSIGLPALNGFIGEILILQGVFVRDKLWAAFAASGIVLGAAYMLWLYQRTMFGKIENPKNEGLQDLNLREFATYAPLIVLAVWIGIYPAPFIRRLDTSVARVMARVNSIYAPQNANTTDCISGTGQLVASGAAVAGGTGGQGRPGSPFVQPPCETPAGAPQPATPSEHPAPPELPRPKPQALEPKFQAPSPRPQAPGGSQ
jgi:NADH-quinone oxidoreductase subunit M